MATRNPLMAGPPETKGMKYKEKARVLYRWIYSNGLNLSVSE